MKKLIYYLFLTLSLITLWGCGEDEFIEPEKPEIFEPEEPEKDDEIRIELQEYTPEKDIIVTRGQTLKIGYAVYNAATDAEIKVSATEGMEAVIIPDGYNPSIMYHYGKISLTASELNADSRITLSVTDGERTASLTVGVEEKTLTVTQRFYETGNEGDIITIPVETNTGYGIKASQWITPVIPRATHTEELQFRIAANTDTPFRSGTVTIKSHESSNPAAPPIEHKIIIVQGEGSITGFTTVADDEVTVDLDAAPNTFAAEAALTVGSVFRRLNIKGESGKLALVRLDFDSPTLKVIDLSGITGWTSVFMNTYFNPEYVEQIILPETITGLEGFAFADYKALTQINLPGALNIGDNAFMGCTSLPVIDLPKAESLGTSAFYECTALTSVNATQVKRIGLHTFDGCKALTSADFPQAVSIGQYAFSGCGKLTSIEFPEATEIYGSAFEDCFALTSVKLPKVTRINEFTFKNCSALRELVLTSKQEITLSPSIAGMGFNPANCELTLDISKEGEVSAGNIWQGYTWKSINFVL